MRDHRSVFLPSTYLPKLWLRGKLSEILLGTAPISPSHKADFGKSGKKTPQMSSWETLIDARQEEGGYAWDLDRIIAFPLYNRSLDLLLLILASGNRN
jgi:hypothetical protein